MECSSCSKATPIDAAFCPSCGTPLVSQVLPDAGKPMEAQSNSKNLLIWGLVLAVGFAGFVLSNFEWPSSSVSQSEVQSPSPSPSVAISKPWYPTGYKELTSNVAYMAFAPGQMDCGYSSAHSCYQAFFVTKTACNLFVDVNFLKGGVVVDNGIDSANVAAGEKAILSFASMKAVRYEGKGQVQITDVTCY